MPWVFVYIRDVLDGSLPRRTATTVTLDKSGCVLRPHVLGIQTGDTLRLLNSDPTLHTAHLQAADNPIVNVALPTEGMEYEQRYDRPEIMIPLRCNLHPWTQAYVGVVAHPFFSVSGADGTFHLEGVPVGEYVVEAWHETLGRQVMRLTVARGARSSAEFAFRR